MTRPTLWPAVLCALLAGACLSASPSSRFVVLEPLALPAGGLDAAGPSLEVALMEFPAALDRPQVATRTAAHERRYAEYERWAEPLDAAFARVLAADLRVLLVSQRVVVAPDRLGVSPPLRVALSVDRFEVSDGEGAVLEARWRWSRDAGEAGLGSARIVEAVDGGDLDARVDGLARALHALAAQLAEEHGRLL